MKTAADTTIISAIINGNSSTIPLLAAGFYFLNFKIYKMKKIIAFAVGLFSVTAIFAQSRNHNDRYGNYNESGNVVLGRNQDSHHNGYGYDSNNGYGSHNGYRSSNAYRSNNGYNSQNGHYNYNNYPSQRRDNRYNDQRRREEMDRINGDYDRRIDEYRRDRSINTYERDRRIQQAQRERSEKLKSFAGGAVVGAIAGVLLGTVLSH